MNPIRSLHLLVPGMTLLLTSLCLQANSAPTQVKFADSSKPGHLKIYIANGDLHITPGEQPGLVSVKAEGELKPATASRDDGLRVLSDTSDVFSLTAEGNNAELSYGREGWTGAAAAKMDIQLPKNTALEIQNGWGGSINIEGIDGDISIKALNCEVDLSEVAGAASIETMNGAINATYRSLPDGKPVSISTMNGEVVLRVPNEAKANVRFRTHNGSILTDFAEDKLKTSSENLGGTSWGAIAGKHAAIAVHIAKEVGKEIAETAKEAAENAREAAESASEAAREAKEAEEEKNEASQGSPAPTQKESKLAQPPKPPFPHAPLTPPNIPAISGGKVVSGTLNGGGSPILITTMNGNITFRHR